MLHERAQLFVLFISSPLSPKSPRLDDQGDVWNFKLLSFASSVFTSFFIITGEYSDPFHDNYMASRPENEDEVYSANGPEEDVVVEHVAGLSNEVRCAAASRDGGVGELEPHDFADTIFGARRSRR
eukprot:IDg9411t1